MMLPQIHDVPLMVLLFLLPPSARVSGSAAAAAGANSLQPQRHILLMLIDDLGFADVGYHGQPVGSQMVTPTIDRLSAEGVRLEQYYVTFLCSPTRTSLLRCVLPPCRWCCCLQVNRTP
jgi:hypothetical protein